MNMLQKQNVSHHPASSTYPDFFDEDRWEAEKIGLEPDHTNSAYYVSFTRIKQTWLKQAVKKFIYLQSASKSFSSCRSYTAGLAHFSKFLENRFPQIVAKQIDRELILHFIGYLTKNNLSITTKKIALIHLRTFHEYCIQEKWLPFSSELWVHHGDLPDKAVHTPKFIPEMVIEQLERHIHHFPQYRQRLILLLLETGRRVSEVCALSFDCLSYDKQNDPFLKVKERKLKKSYLIPLSAKAHKIIQAQQIFSGNIDENKRYLFPAVNESKALHLTTRHINESLNKLAKDQSIVDENGKIWHFHSHQFRHTVGTRMINSGVPQAIVQQFLGHETPEMTSRYAHIHQETLKSEFQKFNQKLIDTKGQIYKLDSDSDAQWLRHNIMAQTLPNGLCALPTTQHACPHANACLSCAHFRTNKQFLPQHKKQLGETKKLVFQARDKGWQRQLEMNEAIQDKLEIIVNTLENDNE